MLERYAVKVARTVLRGGSGRNATPLPDQWTVGILRHYRAFSTPEQNLGLGVLSTPAPPPLTQTVSCTKSDE